MAIYDIICTVLCCVVLCNGCAVLSQVEEVLVPPVTSSDSDDCYAGEDFPPIPNKVTSYEV